MGQRITYANVMSTIAVFLALGGGTAAVALSGKNSVKKDDIAKGAVRSDDIAANAVLSGEVATDSLGAGDLAIGSVGSAELLDGSVGSGEIAAASVGTTKHAAVPTARLGNTGTQSIAASTFTTLSFNLENVPPTFFDPFGMLDPAAPTSVKVPESGIYLVTLAVVWAADDTAVPGGNADQGFRFAQITTPGGNARSVMPSVIQGNTENTHQRVSDIFQLAAGQTLTAGVDQDNADSSAIDAGGQLTIIWLGPSV